MAKRAVRPTRRQVTNVRSASRAAFAPTPTPELPPPPTDADAPPATPTRRRAATPPQAPARSAFLKYDNIGPNGATLVPIPGTVRIINGQYGSQIVVDVRLNGSPRQVFAFGINVNLPNLRLLVEHLITAPGQPIEVFGAISANQRPYIAIQSHGEARHDDEIPF